MGKQKRGVSGADNATEMATIAKTSGEKIRDVIIVGTVAECLCFASVHDVINTVNINFIFVTSSFTRSVMTLISISCAPTPISFHHVLPRSIHTNKQHMVTSRRHLKVFCQAHLKDLITPNALTNELKSFEVLRNVPRNAIMINGQTKKLNTQNVI